MKGRTQRRLQKIFLPVLGLSLPFTIFMFTQSKDFFITQLSNYYLPCKPPFILLILSYPLYFILLLCPIFFIFKYLYICIFKPKTDYFQLINFKTPIEKTIQDATKGILDSEKAQPFFVHVAPISDEIEQMIENLNKHHFVWENGKPGDGKTMLAYHTLYQKKCKTRIGFSNKYSIKKFWNKFIIYELILDRIKKEDKNEINAILTELDSLKGNKRKIILIDDAHLLEFEKDLRYEFEKEAKDNSGNFIWVNTNYLDINDKGSSESITVDFKKIYPKLLEYLYETKNPIIQKVVKEKCSNLKEAKKLVEDQKINDSWHFNFVATNGENRIKNLLYKLNTDNQKKSILFLTIFLFSARNIITGEKEIYQNEFTNLLNNIKLPVFREQLNNFSASEIILFLGKQENGRLLIIESNKPLRAPHFRLSIALIKSMTTEISDIYLMKQIIDISSELLLTTDFKESKYFTIYFNAIGIQYQNYFLQKNKKWVEKFLNELVMEQLSVYPYLLKILEKHHKEIYYEFINDKYIETITYKISFAMVSNFTSIMEFINALNNHKEKQQQFITNLDYIKLAQQASEANIMQFKQLADFMNTLKLNTEKQQQFIDNLNFTKLAEKTKKADVAQFQQLADFINALSNHKKKQQQFINYLNLIKLVDQSIEIDMAQFQQLAYFIIALKNYIGKQDLFIRNLNVIKLAKQVNKANIFQFEKLETIINALKNYTEKQGQFINNLNVIKLARQTNEATMFQFGQLGGILSALKFHTEKQQQFIDNLNFIKLAKQSSEANIAQFQQLAYFIIPLKNHTEKLQQFIDNLDFIKLASQTNEANVAQLKQLADFISALGNHKEKLSNLINIENLIELSIEITSGQIAAFCIIIASLNAEKKNRLINLIDWIAILNKVNITNKIRIRDISYILNYLSEKHMEYEQLVRKYILENQEKIISYSTKKFICPLDFKYTADFLFAIFPYNTKLDYKIANHLKGIITNQFNIIPKYYASFSYFLTSIHQLDTEMSNAILTHSNVKKALYSSFNDKDMDDQITGLTKLLVTIKEINHEMFDEINDLHFLS